MSLFSTCARSSKRYKLSTTPTSPPLPSRRSDDGFSIKGKDLRLLRINTFQKLHLKKTLHNNSNLYYVTEVTQCKLENNQRKSITRRITRITCFLFLLENTETQKENKLLYFHHQNVNSLCSRHHYVNSSR